MAKFMVVLLGLVILVCIWMFLMSNEE